MSRRIAEDADNLTEVFYLDTDPDDFPVDSDWRSQMRRLGMCCDQGCSSVRPEHYGTPITVPLKHIPTDTIVDNIAATVVNRRLFDLLAPHMPPHVVGPCVLASSGRPVDEYVSVYTRTKDSPTTRGGRGSKYWVCSTCGYRWLEGDGTDSQVRYYLRSDLGQYRAWQEGNHGSFLVTPSLRDSIDWAEFPDISFYPYPVLDKPLDEE